MEFIFSPYQTEHFSQRGCDFVCGMRWRQRSNRARNTAPPPFAWFSTDPRFSVDEEGVIEMEGLSALEATSVPHSSFIEVGTVAHGGPERVLCVSPGWGDWVCCGTTTPASSEGVGPSTL